MNDLEKYFYENTERMIYHWPHYFEIYERHFARFRGKEVTILEFGVFQGGSLRMWKTYFGPNAQIYGVDFNPACEGFAEDRVTVFTGDQDDLASLRGIAARIPKIDILIEDGGQKMNQKINTLEVFLPLISENGIYCSINNQGSYFRRLQGGFRRRGTFIEYSKKLIDRLHAWYSEEPSRLAVDDFTRSVHSIHYYPGIMMVEKRKMEPPKEMKTGVATLPNFCPSRTLPEKARRWLKEKLRQWTFR